MNSQSIKINLFAFLLMGMLLPLHSLAQPPSIDISRANYTFSQERYGNGLTRFLVEGDNWQRRGEWEKSILAYDNAIAQWPYWAPAYVRRAMAFFRQGRQTEGERDLARAFQLSPLAVKLFGEHAIGHRHRLMATPSPDSSLDAVLSQQLTQVYAWKNSGVLGSAWAAIDQLADTQALPAVDIALLRGNWSLLNQDALTAIEYYDWALLSHTYPELFHNRGLARILSYNFADGCADLETANSLGYAQSGEYWSELCGH